VTSLEGVSVVVTRSPGQSTELVEAITAAGGEVVQLPMIDTRLLPDAPNELRDRIAAGEGDEWLIVLSPNGARYVVDAFAEQPSQRLAVVGPATARAFVDLGWQVTLRPGEPTAAQLAAELPEEGKAIVAQAVIGRRELRDDLRARGWQVDVIALYETIAPPNDDAMVERARAADVVVLTSPSAVRNYADTVGTHQLAICIGPTTETEADSLGFATATAAGPTVDALMAQLLTSR